jgi:light-regulated signal transduction histidine kinase (bacteriophytochrome)
VPTTNDGTPRERELQRANDFHALLLAVAGHDLRQALQVIMNAVIMNAYDWLSRRLETSSEKEYLRRRELD